MSVCLCVRVCVHVFVANLPHVIWIVAKRQHPEGHVGGDRVLPPAFRTHTKTQARARAKQPFRLSSLNDTDLRHSVKLLTVSYFGLL